jgi:hypothetical protein
LFDFELYAVHLWDLFYFANLCTSLQFSGLALSTVQAHYQTQANNTAVMNTDIGHYFVFAISYVLVTW